MHRLGTDSRRPTQAALAAAGLVLLAWPASSRIDTAAFASLPVRILWAAVWEELVFRGWLQPTLMSRHGFNWHIARISAANVASSLVFVAAHLWTQPAWLAPGYFATSIWLGVLRERLQSVYGCVALHAALNILWWQFTDV